MRCVIRVDASHVIGSGHVMRCLTLAKALKKIGVQVMFVCRDFPGNMSEFIKEQDFNATLLPFDSNYYSPKNYLDEYSFWLGVSQEQDADDVLEHLKTDYDLLIVDHYGIDHHWEKKLRSKFHKIFVIDDLANRKHRCDFLLDHNFYIDSESRYFGLVPENSTTLLGPKYALISSEVQEARKLREQQYKPFFQYKMNCLVFMGGADAGNYSTPIVKAIIHSSDNVKVTLVLGKNNPLVEDIRREFKDNGQVEVLIQPTDYHQYLANADLVIGAGGVSVLERFCIGVPSIVFQVAENQREICNAIAATEAAYFLGEPEINHGIMKKDLGEVVGHLSEEQLQFMTLQGKGLVDGDGVDRVIRVMCNSYDSRFVCWKD